VEDYENHEINKEKGCKRCGSTGRDATPRDQIRMGHTVSS